MPSTPEARKAEGKRLFERAQKLAKAYRHFEACALMERSYRLHASLGTRFWLARCKTTVGQLASATKIYRELLATLRRQNKAVALSDDERRANDKRIALLEKDLTAVEVDVPSLRVQLPVALAQLPGLTLKRNGVVVPRADWTAPWQLDAGTYTIAVSAPGHATTTVVRELANGDHLTVKLRTLVRNDVVMESDPGAVQRALGWTSAALGAASVTAGGVLLLVAKLQYDQSLDGCDEVGCGAESRAEQRAAAVKADVASGLLLGGVAVAGTGMALLLTAPSQANGDASGVQLAAGFTPTGVRLLGRW